MTDDDEMKPPDWENPPCPACFAFDATAPVPKTPEEYATNMRTAYASGLTTGFLMCRMRADTWQHLCPQHVRAAQTIIDAICADHGIPRDKVYEDIGIPEPDSREKH